MKNCRQDNFSKYIINIQYYNIMYDDINNNSIVFRESGR